LAVGDSYTFGDHVSDHETWPAHLERLLQRPVLNGGVFGYGVDQIILRTEELLPRLRPQVVVVSIIPADVTRTEYSKNFSWKPYYDIRDGGQTPDR
jgi:hypothetical protein